MLACKKRSRHRKRYRLNLYEIIWIILTGNQALTELTENQSPTENAFSSKVN